MAANQILADERSLQIGQRIHGDERKRARGEAKGTPRTP